MMADTEEDGEDLPGMGMGQLLFVLGGYLKPYRFKVALIVVGLLVEMAFTSAVPLSFKLLVDRAVGEHRKDLLIEIIAGLSVGVLAVSIIGLLRDRLDAHLDAAIIRDIRVRLYMHLQRLSLGYYSKSRLGDLLARFSTDLGEVESALNDLIPWGLLPAMDVVASTLLLFYLNWKLALVAMLVWPMCLVGPGAVAPMATRASARRQNDEAWVLSGLQESFSGAPVVKSLDLEGHLLAQFCRRVSRLQSSSVRVVFLGLLVERTAGIGILVLEVAILAVGGYMCYRDWLSVGSLASFHALFGNLAYSLSYVTQYVPSLVGAAGGMARIEEILAKEADVRDHANAEELPAFKREIAFNDVRFSYTGAAPHLDGVTFTVPAGKAVTIVGATGAGKSTIFQLLMRFFDPQSGSITVDGKDVRRVTQTSLRRQIGIVFQETFLFNGTIREAIRAGRLSATNADVEQAAKEAEIHEAILKMPKGYDTTVGERGAHLSGGQRQRIAIARALVRNPAILLLDEATSALDPITDAAIRETLARVGRGRTVITVTHRLSSAAHAEVIYVLDHGRIVEEGSHEELLGRAGAYARLWEKQHRLNPDDLEDDSDEFVPETGTSPDAES